MSLEIGQPGEKNNVTLEMYMNRCTLIALKTALSYVER